MFADSGSDTNCGQSWGLTRLMGATALAMSLVEGEMRQNSAACQGGGRGFKSRQDRQRFRRSDV